MDAIHVNEYTLRTQESQLIAIYSLAFSRGNRRPWVYQNSSGATKSGGLAKGYLSQ